MASISFASESLMDPRIQVKLDKYQKCGNIISQTSLLSMIYIYIYVKPKIREPFHFEVSFIFHVYTEPKL